MPPTTRHLERLSVDWVSNLNRDQEATPGLKEFSMYLKWITDVRGNRLPVGWLEKALIECRTIQDVLDRLHRFGFFFNPILGSNYDFEQMCSLEEGRAYQELLRRGYYDV